MLARQLPHLLAASLLAWRVAAADWPQGVDVDSFVATERKIALQGALNNIGPNGSLVPGAGAGFVVASPSQVNPNCQSFVPLLPRK